VPEGEGTTSFGIQLANIFQYFLDLFSAFCMQGQQLKKKTEIENFCHFDLGESKNCHLRMRI
jgi:hypothetical protein